MMGTARITAAGDDIEFVFYCDEDALLPVDISLEPGVTVISGPRIVLSATWNECFTYAHGDIVMQGNDDVLFRTPGWDQAVEDAFSQIPDRIAFVHGQDLHQPPGTFGTLGFLHRTWVKAVGYVTPPYFSSDYGDTWLNDVANALDRRVYLPEVITEHMHPAAGKAEWDQTHMERLARGSRDDVAGLYASLAPAREEDVRKLRAVMR